MTARSGVSKPFSSPSTARPTAAGGNSSASFQELDGLQAIEPVIFQQCAEALARALRPRRDQHAPAALLQVLDMHGNGIEDGAAVFGPFGGECAADAAAERGA